MGRYLKKFLSILKRIVFSFVGGIFYGILLVYLFFHAFDSQDQVIMHTTLKSSDEKFTAISYTIMGGGAAGYCYSHVSIIPWDKFDRFQKAEFTVASGSCSKPIIKWTSNRTLEITDLAYPYSEEIQNSDGKVKVVHNTTTVRYVDY